MWVSLFLMHNALVCLMSNKCNKSCQVGCMVLGLSAFMHADSKSSAIFQPIGACILSMPIMCDGSLSNTSEEIMNKNHFGQDEFVFSMHSFAFVVITDATSLKGDLV